MDMYVQLKSSPLCGCKAEPLDPDNATWVLKGVGYCNRQCFKKAESAAIAEMRKAKPSPKVHSHWLVTLALALIILTLTFIFTGGTRAWAHNPDTHQVDDLGEASSKLYGSCCIGDDYTKLRIQEWETTERGWRVHYKGQWLEVPKLAKVYNMDNPDGEAKVWIFGEPDTTYVRCFMPGAVS